MTEIVLQSDNFIRMLGIERCPEVSYLIDMGRILGIRKFTIGKVPILKSINNNKNEHFMAINAEPGELGYPAEKMVIEKLSQYERQISFFTANQDLIGISDSIHALTFEQLDRLRSPRSTTDWDFSSSKKERNISMVYSQKTISTGHIIRKYIYDKYKDSGLIDFFLAEKGDSKKHLDNRKTSLERYRYNLIIENTFDEHHISDQLKDSFLGKCIPIYLGNASKFTEVYEKQWGINWDAVIEINSEGLDNILNRVGREEYEKKIDIVERNSICMRRRQIALGWDGKELPNTDMKWLGKLIIERVTAQLKCYTTK